MKDIQQVLRRKRAQQAQLAKEIELLEDVEVKLQQVASLLADDEDAGNLLSDVEEETRRPNSLAAAASAGIAAPQAEAPAPAPITRATVPRWP